MDSSVISVETGASPGPGAGTVALRPQANKTHEPLTEAKRNEEYALGDPAEQGAMGTPSQL